MARDFQIYGETLVQVKLQGGQLQELGLCNGPVRVIPKVFHKDMNVDDFGPNVPAEVMWMLGEVNVKMTLVHYDFNVLQDCIDAAMGSSLDGKLSPAGTIMGGNLSVGALGNFYTQLFLSYTNQADEDDLGDAMEHWRFPASYLCEPMPVEVPVGIERSMVPLNWRVIPYKRIEILSTTIILGGGGSQTTTTPKEIKSGTAILWDREAP